MAHGFRLVMSTAGVTESEAEIEDTLLRDMVLSAVSVILLIFQGVKGVALGLSIKGLSPVTMLSKLEGPLRLSV